ncbi:phosphotransferase [Marmoricola endophyticus]|nr:phosphotransferase [Marmoricola endophyticus]
MSSEEEIALTGGRITKGVVRVSNTVRRPVGAYSEYVHRVLDHLAVLGLTWVPRYLGQDDQDREILTFQPGVVPEPLPRGRWAEPQVRVAATFLRGLPDATAGSLLAAGRPVVCHNDFGPHNLVFSAGTPPAESGRAQIEGLPTGVIDFDQVSPGEREDDLAYAACCGFSGPRLSGN